MAGERWQGRAAGPPIAAPWVAQLFAPPPVPPPCVVPMAALPLGVLMVEPLCVAPSTEAVRCIDLASATGSRPVRQRGSRLVLRPGPRRPRPTRPLAITHLITATRPPTTSRRPGNRSVGGKTVTIYLCRLSFVSSEHEAQC